MLPQLREILRGRRLLLVVAAPAEARAVWTALRSECPPEFPAANPGIWRLLEPTIAFDLVVTGVGKSNAAAGLARVFDPTRHAAVLNIGIGGSLPGGGAALGATVVATASIYADEGLETAEGFTDCAVLGFPLGPFTGSVVPADLALLAMLRPLTDLAVPVATVSTCSGTDALASQVARRTGASAEAMEGAAVAHIAARLGVASAEVRAISNTTGRRDTQVWDVRPALEAMTRVIGRLASDA